MKIWLDDKRPAPPGWVWMTTVRQVTDALKTRRVTGLSLDYNLPRTDRRHTGLDVLKYLYNHPDCPLPSIHMHTANPWGGALMAWYWRGLEGRCDPEDVEGFLEKLDE